MSERRAVQLILDADGTIVDVRRAASPPGWSQRYERDRATVHFTGRGVPQHVCYDDPTQDHPADATFCQALRKATHGKS